MLRASWRDIAVVGEVSRWEQRGGHGYFTLKDRTGCLNGIIFASDLARVPFRVTAGLEVVVRGSLDLWAPQGKFQIKAHAIEPVGRARCSSPSSSSRRSSPRRDSSMPHASAAFPRCPGGSPS